jgi:hypothetical protein
LGRLGLNALRGAAEGQDQLGGAASGRAAPNVLPPVLKFVLLGRMALKCLYKRLVAAAALACALSSWGAQVWAQEQQLDRTVLPIAEPKPATYSELDARQAKAPSRFEVKAPKGAPNVVIVPIDDIGFGGPRTFGGPIRRQTLDQLAQSGLRFNNFHTTALCSPTRMALKTGRNHHTTNTGSITETAMAFPGNTGQLPNSVAPLAEMLRLNGYSTAAFGKWHETAAWETSVSGPFIAGPPTRALTSFTASLVAKPTNGIRSSMMA